MCSTKNMNNTQLRMLPKQLCCWTVVVKSRWSATLFVYLGFNVSRAVPTCCNGYWNNTIIKKISRPINRRKQEYSGCVAPAGQCQPCLHCSAQALLSPVLPSYLSHPHDSATPVHGGQGAVELSSNQHNTYHSPWQSQDLASSNQNGAPRSAGKALHNILVPGGHRGYSGRWGTVRNQRPLSSNLLPASNREATVPRRTPARPQDWVCWV